MFFAPIVRAAIVARRPTCISFLRELFTGPQPMTTIVSVSSCSGVRSFKALFAAYHLHQLCHRTYPVGKISAIRIASSGFNLGGIGNKVPSASGTNTISACPPSL
jgi:hypothetical protein